MRSIEMLKSLWNGLTTYLLAPDVPTSTRSIADGVLKVLMTPLKILVPLVGICPPRLLIFLTLIVLSLLGAWIISMLYGR